MALKILVLIEENVSRRLPDQYHDAFISNEHATYYVVASCVSRTGLSASRFQGWKFVERPYKGGYLKHVREALTLANQYKAAVGEFGVDRFDKVIAFNHPLLLDVALWVARRDRAEAVFHLNHLMAEELLATRGILAKLKGWYGIQKLKRSLPRFDLGLLMSDTMAAYAITRYRLDPQKTTFWPSQVSPYCHWSPNSSEEVRSLAETIRQRRRAVNLVYSGNLSAGRKLKDFFQTLVEVLETNTDVTLFVMGYSDIVKSESSFYSAFGISNRSQIAYLGNLSPLHMDRVFGEMDIGLSHFDPQDPILYHNSPLKTREYLKAGLSVVASAIPDHDLFSGLACFHTYQTLQELPACIEAAISYRVRGANGSKLVGIEHALKHFRVSDTLWIK